ncbi:hypothetical protein D3C71_1775030 [compost metagenome]
MANDVVEGAEIGSDFSQAHRAQIEIARAGGLGYALAGSDLLRGEVDADDLGVWVGQSERQQVAACGAAQFQYAGALQFWRR